MFVRKKPNKSGTVSVQIIDKSTGRYIVHHTIGSSSEPVEIDFLVNKAKRIILSISQQQLLPFDKKAELTFVDTFVNHLDSFSMVGPELLLGRIFDEIGFNAIADDLFR